jgi:hypothetical protein
MQATSFDIKDMLEAESALGLDFATDLFIGKEPAEPKDCVTIYDYAGYPPYLGLGGEVGYEYPSIQIRVRNHKYEDGWDKINEIKDALHGRHGEIWNGTLYTLIKCSSGPALLDWDDNGNARLVVNFDLQRRDV